MAPWTTLFFMFLLPATALAEESCGLRADLFATKLLIPMTQKSCEEIRDTIECKKLYAEMSKNGEDPKKQLQCKNQNSILRKIENSLETRIGCAVGGANFIIDTLTSMGTVIGEGAAKMSLENERQKAENSICDKDPAKKKALYTDYNDTVPKLLRVAIPSEEVFGHDVCARLKTGLQLAISQQRFAAMDRVLGRINNPNAKYDTDEKEYVDWVKKIRNQGGAGPDIIALAKQKLHELGIKIQCYNDFEAAAITCEAVAAVMSIAAGPAGAAINAARTVKIMKLAGLAEKSAATTTTANAAVNLDRAGKFSDAERIQEAAKVVNRKLSSRQEEAVLKSHEVGKAEGRGYRTSGGKKGEYTQADLKAKSKILKEVDFTSAERRVLMESGITGQNSATSLGRADQVFIQNINNSMSRRNVEALNVASSEGAKYYKAKAKLPEIAFKKAFPEDRGVADLIQANYFGLGTEDSAALVNKYLQAHNYNPEQGKLAIISQIKRENKFYDTPNPKIDSVLAEYRIYRNKELEYKLTMEYYETRYPNKFSELDYDKLSPGQRQNLENLNRDLKGLREKAQRNKWPTANEYKLSY